MITKESLVCTPEQAKLLQSFGVDQNTLFEWTQVLDKRNGGMMNILEERLGGWPSAFTAPELIERLNMLGRYQSRFSKFMLFLKTGFEPRKLCDVYINHLRYGS